VRWQTSPGAEEGEENPGLIIRVCDVAAETISVHRSDVTFTMVGTKAELDAQIQRMQKQLVTPPTQEMMSSE
jgi:hypothetical protein